MTQTRVRRAAFWCGLGVGAGALLLYIPCLFTRVAMGSPERSIVLARGAIGVYWRASGGPIGDGPLDPERWARGPWRLLPRWYEPDPVPTRGGEVGRFVIPLWMPVVFGLWCAYRLLPERQPAHTCECGYDLRAVPARDGRTICPECGHAALGGAA